MNPLLAAVALAPAAAIGSFLNVVASRLPRHVSLIRPPSACESCGEPVRPRDNVPFVSYLVLRGRCRSCRAPIGWRHPAVEAATALLLVGCVLAFGVSLRALSAALFCAALVVVTATDLEHRIVPNRVVLPAAAIVLGLQLVDRPSVEWPVAGLGAAGFLLAAALAYPGGMGMGDVKLALLMGVALGRTVAVALMLGAVTGLVPSVVVIARHGRAGRKLTIPFAPFLAFGGVVALFAGQALLRTYLGSLR